MLSTMTLLVTDQPSTREFVADLFDSIDLSRLEVTSRLDKCLPRLGRKDLALIIVESSEHQDPDTIRTFQTVARDKDIPKVLISRVSVDPTAWPNWHIFDTPNALRELGDYVRELHTRHAHEDTATDPDDAATEQFAMTMLGTEWSLLCRQIHSVASDDTTILLIGETGVGKSRIAKMVHALSQRATKPYVIADCASMNANSIESDLYGHVKGAYTGADRDRIGKLGIVNGGTLVLDEINSLPLTLQPRLLRAVEEQVYEPLGSSQTRNFQARIVAISNIPLEEAVKRGEFRQDLYFRLNVIEFRLPALRERPGAIIPLAHQFVRESKTAIRRGITGISSAAIQKLLDYHWPGNVRELSNLIERAATFAQGSVIEFVDVPTTIPQHKPITIPISVPVPSCEKQRIQDVLLRTHNNRLAAARELGMSRQCLYKKLRKYGLFQRKLALPTTNETSYRVVTEDL
jgi:DNA-binding NtrC family response regulator